MGGMDIGSETIHPHRRGLWPAALLLAVVVAAVYGQVAGFKFLNWDDRQQVVDNPLVNPPSWQGIAAAWRRPYWGLYVPLSYTWFALEAVVARRVAQPDATGGLSPAVFHLGNLFLHLGCTLLTLAILRRLLKLGMAAPAAGNDAAAARHLDVAACAGALLFAVHPLQVESVAWISEGRGLLCACFP